MDLGYLLENENDSDVGGVSFTEEQPGVAVPYLSVMCLVMISGSVGNMLVIAAVLGNKAS